MNTPRFTAARWATLGLLTLTLSVSLMRPAAAQNPSVVPVSDPVNGVGYAEWSARWWQWAFSLPIDKHPLYDTGPASAGQTGNVWFLGGSFVSSDNGHGQIVSIADRTITITDDKYLFFPILNSEASTLEGNGNDDAILRATAQQFQDYAQDMVAEIDGVSIINVGDYRVASPLSVYGPLPDNNIIESFGIPDTIGKTSLFVSDGVFLMAKPLSVGQHTIHFAGDIPAFNFDLDATYHINVVQAVPEPGAIATFAALFGGVGIGLLRARRRKS